jgi:hypothetical protein
MRQSEHNPQFWVELDGGQARPVYATTDLDDATEVAEADVAGDAREPIDGDREAAEVDSGLKRVEAPRGSVGTDLGAKSATVAPNGAALQAAQASIADLARWIDDDRHAALPVIETVVGILDRYIEANPAPTAKPEREEEREAKAAGPIDPMAFGFI